jgi:hypothetical protein
MCADHPQLAASGSTWELVGSASLLHSVGNERQTETHNTSLVKESIRGWLEPTHVQVSACIGTAAQRTIVATSWAFWLNDYKWTQESQ